MKIKELKLMTTATIVVVREATFEEEERASYIIGGMPYMYMGYCNCGSIYENTYKNDYVYKIEVVDNYLIVVIDRDQFQDEEDDEYEEGDEYDPLEEEIRYKLNL